MSTSILNSVWSFLSNNQIFVMVVLFMAFNHWKMRQPFPESGGRVSGVHSDADWDEKVVKHKGLVCVDFYATWCPPCRSAAPVFGTLSTCYPGVEFVKVGFASLDAGRHKGAHIVLALQPTQRGPCLFARVCTTLTRADSKKTPQRGGGSVWVALRKAREAACLHGL